MSWSSIPYETHGKAQAENIIRMTPGPTRFAISCVQDIKSAFELFIPESIQKILIDMTNMEGRRVFKDNWKMIDKTDLDAYLGLLLLAGVYRSNNEATASLWDAETGRSIFRATMSLQTFHVISRVIRFDNRETRVARRAADKLAPIRELWEKSGLHAMPAAAMRGKPAGGVAEKGQGKRVVLEMTEGLRGHNITCDNFFTSYALGEELRRRRLTMVGTVKNKPELPAALTGIKNRAALSSKFAFTETTTTVSYCPRKNKNVIVMSTHHKNAAVSSREDNKPEIILDYNKNKGGVDNLDKVTGTYTCQRMTARWPMAVFYNSPH
ncbi:hypothetical protein AAFF_G00209250 [Aldrovandia affinis]|uniref:PiggyBac transposable element-derived protein domain-containing protein n=1 Tax=Aldrovandia affinis TaxID=143900 RepID=A0AAD7SW44_9TELE|nr:hypothetical protein AAFF_G00209250 [Aldrovandia affinis]